MRPSHIAWNLAGLSIPLLIAVLTVPHLVGTLGSDRFGLLALAWGLVGYASAMDLGIGRALTQMVAGLRGSGATEEVPPLLATAARITLVCGIVGAMLIATFALLAGTAWIATEQTSEREIQVAILLMAVVLPAQAMSATYRGINEAFQNYKGISLLRVALGAINFGGPFIVSFYSQNLSALVSTLVLSRLFALAIYRQLAYSCLAELGPKPASPPNYSRSLAKRLFTFSGWVTVSSVVSPVLVQADRFIIGAFVSASAVTIYVLPYEIVAQSLILVGAISTAAFPSLSLMISQQSTSWESHFFRWLRRVAMLMATVCIVLALTLPYALQIWLQENFHPASAIVGQILCLGVFANSIGAMFYALIHAKGRSDITAKIHLAELPLTVGALLHFVPEHGVIAAAWIWTARMLFDATILAWCGIRK